MYIYRYVDRNDSLHGSLNYMISPYNKVNLQHPLSASQPHSNRLHSIFILR